MIEKTLPYASVLTITKNWRKKIHYVLMEIKHCCRNQVKMNEIMVVQCTQNMFLSRRVNKLKMENIFDRIKSCVGVNSKLKSSLY